ncbi:hypothetical protein [Streptomyces sp. Z26]|uniref:hypothetical protein n=1 Tax=Streptomyces sp. Z26 TaxID=2500177 RepID=UPI000EF17490|nr:hypothetical protein [Streptomyces sp. Z26]RLL67290.1 hypothetical protein D7M15_10935 [Streptomyces sp. Z26]
MLNTSRESRPLGTLPRPASVPVPYITRWSGERAPDVELVVRRGRLAFAKERPYDRDSAGVLWTRTPSQPGKGRPQYGKVHPLRQRNAMDRLLCQVCGQPADRNEDGVLWLVGEDPDDQGGRDGGLHTMHPPLCLPCAHTSIHACPHLRHHYVALRVRRFEQIGVRGALYCPVQSKPVIVQAAGVAFDDHRINWVQAGQLIMHLIDYTPTDLDTEPHQPRA